MDQPPDSRLTMRYPVLGGGFFLAGRAAGDLKRRLAETALAPALVRRVVIATYEAEMNVVIHATSGVIEVEVDGSQVRVVATDHGPGIDDIAQAMALGFSTASEKARSLGFGAGMGLANMNRCSDSLEVSSEVGSGTRVEMTFRPRPQEAQEGSTDDSA